MRRLLCLLALAVFSVVVQARERVADFHSAIEIAADGALTVTETIAVVAEGRQIRRGILRDFPTAYRDRLGHRVNVPFEVLAVERDGARETFALEKLSNGVRLRIGSADRLLARGLHTYRITYRTARQLGFFEKHDELYWNVNGNGWTFAFDAVRADVTLPVAVPRTALRAEAYTGPQGARGRHYTAQLRDGGAGFQTTRGLNPYEGLTLVFEFPKGIIAAPTWLQRARWFLAANRGVFAGFAGFLLLLAFYTWRWTLVGRDPREGPKFPRYEPPPRLGPAGARYVDRMGFDNTCFAVGLLGLGARGYLTIRQDGDTFEIERTGTAVEWLPGERPLGDLMRGPGKPTMIAKTHNPAVQGVRERMALEITAHFGERLFSKNRGSLVIGVTIAMATFAAMATFDAPESSLLAAALVMAATVFAFARWLPAYSIDGRKLQDHIEGLRQYLGVAEADDLRRMKAPPLTKEEFSRFLPYAVALGVEKNWATRFAAVAGAAAVAEAVSSYYVSNREGGFFDRGGVSSFADSISDMGSTVSAASTPPGSSSGGSSGGGGGGSSGGGGGGGGGSGW